MNEERGEVENPDRRSSLTIISPENKWSVH